jgi:Domain of unknown function (DUF3943)
MQYAVMLVPTLFTILSLGSVHVTMAADDSSHRLGDASPTVPVDVDALLRTHRVLLSWHAPAGPAPLALFSDSFSSESSGGAEDSLRLPGEHDTAEDGEVTPGALERDWGGLGRDTAFFLGYEVVAAGILYLLPESVTKWTAEQRKTSMERWWDNVRHPEWDKDTWYVNYLGHPYFGAIAYTRARERQFGAFGGFSYAALLSTLYEFGIEALFERPSYQDLIVTPVGGLLIGALLFEPIRDYIKGKPELHWYDHVTLAVTDPLGTGNSIFERLFGIQTDIRVQVHLPNLARYASFDEPAARSLNRPLEQHRQSPGIGIEFVFEGRKRSAPYILY